MEPALQPNIIVRYKASSCATALKIMATLAPIWLLWLPWSCLWVLFALLDNLKSAVLDNALLVLCVVFCGLFIVCLFTVFVCLQNKFIVNAKGVKFPLRCLLELNFKLNRKWSELESIAFTKLGKPSVEPKNMVLRFKYGTLPLELGAFTKEDLQKLLMAVEAYCPNIPVNPATNEVKLGISMTKSASPSGLSFTKIWEDDLSHRFGSTVFVPLEPGESLQNGSLQVVGQIAFGGLSAIYLAKRKTGELCVIKEAVIPANADEASKLKAMELFQREATLLMSLRHPRVARVFDNFVENGRHYLLLEHVDGRDLRRFVKEQGPRDEETVARWAAEILDVLVYLHSLNPPVIHRDITPDNLVLEPDGSITVIDFGAANEFLGTATGTLVGKQSYIAPEQFRGKSTPQSDLYSLGATLHYLLTASDPEALSESHPRDLAPQVSEAMDSFIARLTAMNLEERFADASEALAAGKSLRQRKSARGSSAVTEQP